MLTNNDIKKIIIIATLIIFWPQISDFLNPKKKEKKKEEKDVEIDDISVPYPERPDCKHIIYEPMSMAGPHTGALLPKGFCYVGDSYFDDKPYGTGDKFADEQAEQYESNKKSEGVTANLDSIAIILSNTGTEEITTDVADSTEEENTWSLSPDAPIGLDATDVDTDSFTANWTATQNITGYYLDVATDINFTSFVTGYENKDVGNVIEYSIEGLDDGINYYYRIRAYNNFGISSFSNIISTETAQIFDDWFLPSIEESGYLYSNRVFLGMAGIYWSSNEGSSSDAYNVNYDTGLFSVVSKENVYKTKPIRRYISSSNYNLLSIGQIGIVVKKDVNGDGTFTYIEVYNEDLANSIYSDDVYELAGADSTDGQVNTLAIIASPYHTTSAAKLCNDLIVI